MLLHTENAIKLHNKALCILKMKLKKKKKNTFTNLVFLIQYILYCTTPSMYFFFCVVFFLFYFAALLVPHSTANCNAFECIWTFVVKAHKQLNELH